MFMYDNIFCFASDLALVKSVGKLLFKCFYCFIVFTYGLSRTII